MRTLLLLFALALTFASCTIPEQTAEKILKGQGYSNIQITGYDPWGCGEGDSYSTGFTATTVTGEQVRGVICGGVLKGYTIRLKY